jgi:predicted ArsR family transcriptional regulator
MLESIADPIRLRVVRHLDEHGAASLTELADVAGAHVNTVRPHLQAMEGDGVVQSRQRAAQGPGRRVIEYYLSEPLSVADSDLMAMTELLAAALARAQLDPPQLRRIGADWGRFLSGRPGGDDPEGTVRTVLGRFGYGVELGDDQVRLSRCLCPLVSPDSPHTICALITGVTEGALGASGSDLQIDSAEHAPQERTCVLRLRAAG